MNIIRYSFVVETDILVVETDKLYRNAFARDFSCKWKVKNSFNKYITHFVVDTAYRLKEKLNLITILSFDIHCCHTLLIYTVSFDIVFFFAPSLQTIYNQFLSSHS